MKLVPKRNVSDVLENLDESHAQLLQDLFVLGELDFKRDGYFVEFGATDGKLLSNTYLLEKKFGWKGILAEPAKTWYSDLVKNRSAHISEDCVWRATGETLEFHEAEIGEVSSIASFKKNSLGVRRYDVRTISLLDLLEKYEAPTYIDYLSLDTEGSEFEILKGFDFSKYKFRAITCEHNFSENRERIFDLLSRHGYTRKFESVSWVDDWYVLDET